MVKLNLGCGEDYKEGYKNIDCNKKLKADVHGYIEDFLGKQRKETVEEIILSHVLEHLDDPIKVLKEVERVLTKEGVAIVTLPHHNYLDHHRDLTHRFFCTRQTFCEYVQRLSYGTNFKILKQDFVCPLKTIVGGIGLKNLERIGYPIYQVTWWLKK